MLGAPLAVCVALAGMVSAVALFNALLLSYSRIPFAMAGDRLLPGFLSRADSKGTPRNAVILSAVWYSVFALLSFAHLVVADVLLYSMALFLEFGALIALRMREPGLRGAFRIPVGTAGVVLLATVPVVILLIVTGLELRDGEYGLPAIIAAFAAAAIGLPGYWLARRFLQASENQVAR
jgi:amino acid transporter